MPYIFDDVEADLVNTYEKYDKNRYTIVRRLFVRMNKNWCGYSEVSIFVTKTPNTKKRGIVMF